jgi:hypothetical protein
MLFCETTIGWRLTQTPYSPLALAAFQPPTPSGRCKTETSSLAQLRYSVVGIREPGMTASH